MNKYNHKLIYMLPFGDFLREIASENRYKKEQREKDEIKEKKKLMREYYLGE